MVVMRAAGGLDGFVSACTVHGCTYLSERACEEAGQRTPTMVASAHLNSPGNDFPSNLRCSGNANHWEHRRNTFLDVKVLGNVGGKGLKCFHVKAFTPLWNVEFPLAAGALARIGRTDLCALRQPVKQPIIAAWQRI